jgi:hypothetical protein
MSPGSPDVEGLDAALAIFYNAHLVGNFGVPKEDPNHVLFRNVLVFPEALYGEVVYLDSPVPSVLWLLLPVVVLISVGFVLDQLHDAGDTSVESSMTTGALLTLGYLPLVLLGTVRFTDVEMVRTILIAGILYPIVLGGFGGYLSQRIGTIGVVIPPLRSRLNTD